MTAATLYAATVDGEVIATRESAAGAWWALYHARADAERLAEVCDVCDNTAASHGVYGDCDDDSEIGDALSDRARLHVAPGELSAPVAGWRGATGSEALDGPAPIVLYAVREVTA